MLYSKNGSIPKPETDGTEGWIEIEVAPVPGDGEEVVWWYPPGWVVRPVKPDDEPGHQWNWSQSNGEWVKSSDVIVIEPYSAEEVIIDLGADTIVSISGNESV